VISPFFVLTTDNSRQRYLNFSEKSTVERLRDSSVKRPFACDPIDANQERIKLCTKVGEEFPRLLEELSEPLFFFELQSRPVIFESELVGETIDCFLASIDAFLTACNKDPKPFVWTATVESITEKLPRCRRTLEKRSNPAAPIPEAGSERNNCPSISCTLH
jgi:hypothetical protein